MLFSKYPVPERSSLPQDLQVVLAETEEKVNFCKLVKCFYTPLWLEYMDQLLWILQVL